MIMVQMSPTLHDTRLHFMFHKGYLDGTSFSWITEIGTSNGIYYQHMKNLGDLWL